MAVSTQNFNTYTEQLSTSPNFILLQPKQINEDRNKHVNEYDNK